MYINFLLFLLGAALLGIGLDLGYASVIFHGIAVGATGMIRYFVSL